MAGPLKSKPSSDLSRIKNIRVVRRQEKSLQLRFLPVNLNADFFTAFKS